MILNSDTDCAHINYTAELYRDHKNKGIILIICIRKFNLLFKKFYNFDITHQHHPHTHHVILIYVCVYE